MFIFLCTSTTFVLIARTCLGQVAKRYDQHIFKQLKSIQQSLLTNFDKEMIDAMGNEDEKFELCPLCFGRTGHDDV